jgi:hypothetical protein
MAQVTCQKFTGSGIAQQSTYDMLYNIKESINGICTHLDADATITDTNYNSTLAISLPTHGFSASGMSQQDIYDALVSITTNFNLLLAKIDLDDASVTNYAAVCAVTNRMSPTGYLIHQMKPNGISQGDLVWYLDLIRTNIALCTAKLDGSAGVASTDYAATYNVTDVIDSTNT